MKRDMHHSPPDNDDLSSFDLSLEIVLAVLVGTWMVRRTQQCGRSVQSMKPPDIRRSMWNLALLLGALPLGDRLVIDAGETQRG